MHIMTFVSKYFKEISDRYPVFDTFNNMTKIVFLFNNVDPFICRSVAACVNTCMDKRNSYDYLKII